MAAEDINDFRPEGGGGHLMSRRRGRRSTTNLRTIQCRREHPGGDAHRATNAYGTLTSGDKALDIDIHYFLPPAVRREYRSKLCYARDFGKTVQH